MATTTNSDFGANTEALVVAESFAAQVRGKTVLITGGNRNGIGYATSQAIASQTPAILIIAGRNLSRVQECIDALTVEFPSLTARALQVDLSSQQSVRRAAAEVLGWSDVPTIDIVINSAGVMGIQERTLTEDGIEMHFATNHIGHWLLTCLIMPKLIKASENNPRGATRVVNVTSASPMSSCIRWSDINFDTTNKDLPETEQPNYQRFAAWGYIGTDEWAYVPLDGYDRSKVANVLFGIGANKRLFTKHGILVLAVHPGIIQTELGRNFSSETHNKIKEMKDNGLFAFKTLGAGASTSLVAALDPKLAVGVGETMNNSENWGSYLEDCQINGKADPRAISSKQADRLWGLSEELVKEKFSW